MLVTLSGAEGVRACSWIAMPPLLLRVSRVCPCHDVYVLAKTKTIRRFVTLRTFDSVWLHHKLLDL